MNPDGEQEVAANDPPAEEESSGLDDFPPPNNASTAPAASDIPINLTINGTMNASLVPEDEPLNAPPKADIVNSTEQTAQKIEDGALAANAPINVPNTNEHEQ